MTGTSTTDPTVVVAAVALGGLVGAPVRYHVDRFVTRIALDADRVLPFGTLTVNLVGCLLLGIGIGWTIGGSSLDPTGAWYHLLAVGFCGSLTTYSTFGYETLRLVEDGARTAALLNVAVSVTGGLLAAALGWFAGSWL